MFFQTSAATGGITKNGEITRMRTIPWPKIGWSISSAMAMPPTTVISEHAEHDAERVADRLPEGRDRSGSTGSSRSPAQPPAAGFSRL